MVLKEQIYAWYPQVDVPDYTAAKPDSDEIECLYRQATNHYLEKPPTNSVPTIGFRISRKTAQEGEEELSSVEFLRRCKSAPLRRGSCEEISPCPSSRSDINPKTKVKSFLTVPNTEDPKINASIKEFTPHSRSPRQSAAKIRPSSTSMVTGKKSEADQCARKLSPARINRHVHVQRPGYSPVIVVAPPCHAHNKESSLSKSSPKLSSPMLVARETLSDSNSVVRSQNSARSYVSRSRITTADSRLRGRVNRQNSNNKENTVNISYSWKPSETSNQRTNQRGFKTIDQNNHSGRHQSEDEVQNENRNALQDVSITGKNVVGLGKKSKGDNSKLNPQIKVLQPSESNLGRPEVGSNKSTSKTDIRELAMKEIKQYDSEDYERDLRSNGWRMELPGNKFGLKKTPVRLPYWVPLVVPKVPEQPPVFYTNSTSTFFYNTIPRRPKRMVISQNWHSEIGYEQRLANINRKRRNYQYRNWSFVY